MEPSPDAAKSSGSSSAEQPRSAEQPPEAAAPPARKPPAADHVPSAMFLWVLALTAFAINLGYGIVIPISKELAQRCGSDEGSTGAAFAAIAVALMSFNLAKVLGEVPGGIFSDRIGDRIVLASSLFIYGISVVMLIQARSYFPFTSARFIEGLATGVSYPSMTSVLLRHSPRNKLGRNMSIALGAGVAGIVLGPVVAGPLVQMKSVPLLAEKNIDRPLYFALLLTVGVFVLAVAWFWSAQNKGEEAELSDRKVEEKAVATDALLAGGPGPTIGHAKDSETFLQGIVREFKVLGRFGKSATFLGLLAPLFFDKLIMCAWQIILLAHAPRLWPGHGEAIDKVGQLMALMALSFAIVTPISGPLADRFSPRLLTHGSLIGIVASLGVMIVTWTPWSFMPLFGAYCVFSAMLLTVHLKMVGDIYHEESQHGRIFGIVHALSDAGMVVGPTFIWLYNSTETKLGPVICFAIMAGLGGLSIPAFVFSQGREKSLPRP